MRCALGPLSAWSIVRLCRSVQPYSSRSRARRKAGTYPLVVFTTDCQESVPLRSAYTVPAVKHYAERVSESMSQEQTSDLLEVLVGVNTLVNTPNDSSLTQTFIAVQPQSCMTSCQQQTSMSCCGGVQTQFQQPIESGCCVQQYEQPCQCIAAEPCCAEPTLPPTTTTTLPPITTTLAPSTFATSTFAPSSSCTSCPAAPCTSCSVVQPAYQISVVVQCAPACQPSCHPSCVAQPVNAYSQYNMATTSCATQVNRLLRSCQPN
uniref:Extracellular matrix protein n=1 Tax=Ascaris lumbricoides TaxID=6252 RepID=A0A0M3IG55_ASCLU